MRERAVPDFAARMVRGRARRWDIALARLKRLVENERLDLDRRSIGGLAGNFATRSNSSVQPSRANRRSESGCDKSNAFVILTSGYCGKSREPFVASSIEGSVHVFRKPVMQTI